MDFPLPLRAAIEQQAQGAGTAALAAEAKELSRRYREETGAGKRLVTTGPAALAYAIMRMPATFGAVSAALSWTLPYLKKEPASLLDVGAGTGAASWAATAFFELDEAVCLEKEPVMARLGQKLMESGPEVLQKARWVASDLSDGSPLPKKDLVSASYVLGELTEEARSAVLSRLWQAAGELLLLVEPGTPEAFRQMRSAREQLLGMGAHLLAPCPHPCRCPISDDDWCHFTCRVARSRLHRQLKGGDAPYEDEKFTYLAFARSPGGCAPARVLRHPRIESGNVTLRLCTPEGIVTQPVRKRDGALFKTARKAGSGDSFPPKR